MGQSKPSAIELAKAAAHPLRVCILASLQQGLASPNQLAKELDEPLGNVSYHVKTLLDYGCVELVKTEPRRGAVEHFYRSTNQLLLLGASALTDSQCQLAAGVLDKVLSNGVAEKFPDLTKEQIGELAAAQKILAGSKSD